MRQSPLPSALVARLRALDDDAALWRRLERYRWPSGVTCLACEDGGMVVRLLRPRSYPAHHKCCCCGLYFTAIQNTPLAHMSLGLRGWASLAIVLGHYRKPVSATVFADIVPATPTYLRLAQVAVLRTAHWHPLLIDLLTGEDDMGERLGEVRVPPIPKLRPPGRCGGRQRRAEPT